MIPGWNISSLRVGVCIGTYIELLYGISDCVHRIYSWYILDETWRSVYSMPSILFYSSINPFIAWWVNSRSLASISCSLSSYKPRHKWSWRRKNPICAHQEKHTQRRRVGGWLALFLCNQTTFVSQLQITSRVVSRMNRIILGPFWNICRTIYTGDGFGNWITSESTC